MNLVPTASTTAALALGDALAMTLLVRKGLPRGALRRPASRRQARASKLMRVESVMHGGDAAPTRPAVDASMPDVIHEMSSKRLGMTCVVDDDGRLVGHHHRRRPAPADDAARAERADADAPAT